MSENIMILRRIALLPLIAVAAFALADCGPSSEPKHTAAAAPSGPQFVSGPNACDVLDDATAKQLLGDAAKQTRKAQPNPYMSQCQYTSPNGSISIMVGDWKMIHTASPQDKATAGLGDEAYDTPGLLVVRKGEVGMSISVIVSSGEFWGKAADDALSQMSAAQKKVAEALVPKL
jgi:hypothetical protein